MKETIFLACLSIKIIFIPSIFSQQIDTIPPTITVPVDTVFANYKADSQIDYINPDTILVGLSCKNIFPEDYNNFPIPVVKDEVDPNPTVTITTLTDTVLKKVTRTWIATDSAGNFSSLTIVTYHLPNDYQLLLNNIIVNNSITIFSTIQPLPKLDSILFCKNSSLTFLIDSYWACVKNKKEFFWNVNDKPVYSEDDKPFKLSLDTLPQTFKVIVQANVTIGNNLTGLGLTDNKIEFKVNQTSGGTITVANPACTGSSDGTIRISDVGNITWDNGSTNSFRLGLNPGKYWVTYQKDTCAITDTILLKPDNTIHFEVSDETVNLSNKDYVTLTNTSSLTGNYSWHIGDSIFQNNTKVFNFNLQKAGDLKISLSLANNPCTDDFSKIITITGSLPDGYAIFFDKQDINIAPTIAQRTVKLTVPNEGLFMIKIVNLNGTEIYTKNQFISNELLIPIDHLPDGMYILIAKTSQNRSYIKKFIKTD